MLAETMWCSALLRSVTSLISQRIVPRRPPRSRIQAIVTAAGKADLSRRTSSSSQSPTTSSICMRLSMALNAGRSESVTRRSIGASRSIPAAYPKSSSPARLVSRMTPSESVTTYASGAHSNRSR